MRKYDDEFKREAVRKIHDGQSVASVARELGCAESLLHRWKRDVLDQSSDTEREVLTLKKRVRALEMERDILKNVLYVWLRRRSQLRNESCWHKAGRMQQMYPASLL